MKKLIGKILFSLILLSTISFASNELLSNSSSNQCNVWVPGCGYMIVVGDCCVQQKPYQGNYCAPWCW